GPQGRSFQSGGFGLVGDEVGVLNGLAGGAFAEVVDGGECNDQISLGIGGVGDEDEVGAGGPLGVRRFVGDADKGAIPVEVAGDAEALLGRRFSARVAGGE